MKLYNETCFECSKIITQKYSTSFSLGIKAFDKEFHYPIYAIYGFVRYADEIVDTFHDYDKASLIQSFREETFRAIESKISTNPILQSFQLIVNQYQIDESFVDAFLTSMEMDLHSTSFSQDKYDKYIYGSAEVVGLMCLKVFCANDKDLFDKLIVKARSLGSAFQKVNFLRDIKSDFEVRGRMYFPHVEFKSFSETDKYLIETDIQIDFDNALEGIKDLPKGARKGVYIAYVYYLELFKKIKSLTVNTVSERRIRVSDRRKMWLMARALVKNKLKVI